jgi:hypothetical protein
LQIGLTEKGKEMSRRFIEWQRAVFQSRTDVLVASGFDSIAAADPVRGTKRMLREAATALRALAEIPGVHVAIVSPRPLASLAELCVDAPSAWLVADSGRALRDPDGRQRLVGHPHDESRPHALRDVMSRLPRGTAVLLGIDERRDCGAVAATHVRPTGLVLHVSRIDRPTESELCDGVVHGRAAWLELLQRLAGALSRRRGDRDRLRQLPRLEERGDQEENIRPSTQPSI